MRCVLYLRLEPVAARAATAGAGVRNSRPGGDGAADGLRPRALLLLRARFQRRRRNRASQGLLGRPGVRHDGGAPMIDLSVRIGGLTLANPVMPASGTFAEGLDKVMD